MYKVEKLCILFSRLLKWLILTRYCDRIFMCTVIYVSCCNEILIKSYETLNPVLSFVSTLNEISKPWQDELLDPNPVAGWAACPWTPPCQDRADSGRGHGVASDTLGPPSRGIKPVHTFSSIAAQNICLTPFPFQRVQTSFSRSWSHGLWKVQMGQIPASHSTVHSSDHQTLAQSSDVKVSYSQAHWRCLAAWIADNSGWQSCFHLWCSISCNSFWIERFFTTPSTSSMRSWILIWGPFSMRSYIWSHCSSVSCQGRPDCLQVILSTRSFSHHSSLYGVYREFLVYIMNPTGISANWTEFAYTWSQLRRKFRPSSRHVA